MVFIILRSTFNNAQKTCQPQLERPHSAIASLKTHLALLGAQDKNLHRGRRRLTIPASNASRRRGETGGTPATPLHYL
jgi:hypothetical protein